MLPLADVIAFLDSFAPAYLAEDWDNVGLLVGDPRESASRVMTCLTITPASCAEAIAKRAELIVTHHPLPFRALKRLTTATTPGKLLLDLVRAGIAVHSPHTAFDSAAEGINQQLAAGLGLVDVRPLLPRKSPEEGSDDLGSGRWGRLPEPVSLRVLADRLKTYLQIGGLHAVGDDRTLIQTAAVACGSAGSFLEPAISAGCQLLVTGETNFHTCLEAEAQGVALLLPGHFASERFAVVRLAEILSAQFPTLTIWASEVERDPLRWIS